jgi:hypothetical protein
MTKPYDEPQPQRLKGLEMVMRTTPYRCISGDSHLEVDAKRWLHRVPEKYRDRAPRLIKTATGGDA